MSFHSLSNFEIDEFFKKNKIRGKCISNDHFSIAGREQPKKCFYVINLQNQNESGSHWQLIDNRNKDYMIHFCSFGLFPNKSIISLAKKQNKTLYYSDAALQRLDGVECGYFCCYVAYEMSKSKRKYTDILYNDFTSELSKLKTNTSVLSKFFKSHSI